MEKDAKKDIRVLDCNQAFASVLLINYDINDMLLPIIIYY